MAITAERFISHLELPLTAIGDSWYALRDESTEAFLYLTDADIDAYVGAMAAEDMGDPFGPDVSRADAAYRLALIHVEEDLYSGHGGFRYVVVDNTSIRRFDSEPPLVIPPGDYEWRAF